MQPEGYLSGIKKNDFIVTIFHNDCDGISSASLLNKFLEEKRGKGIDYIISQPMPVEKTLIKKIQTSVPTKIIFLDLAVDQQEDVVKTLKGIADILVIDHHELKKDLNKYGIVHYNPKMKKPKIYQSASYVTYKILNRLHDMEKWLWLAAVGMIGDYELKDSEDLVRKVSKTYGIKGRLYESELGTVADFINAVKISRKMKTEKLFEAISYCKSYSDILNNEKLCDIYKEVQNEIDNINLDDVERVGNIVFLNLKSKFDLRSTIATKLGEKYMKDIAVVYQSNKNKINISARNQSKAYNLNTVFKEITKGIGTGGGHPAAAAAKIKKGKWDEFKNRLIEMTQQ